MKLTAFNYAGASRLGVVHGEQVIDLPAALEAYQQTTGADGEFIPAFPTNMMAYLEGGENAHRSVSQLVVWAREAISENKSSAFLHLLSEIQFTPIIEQPSKIICIGLNYADHCREQNFEIPTSILLFSKFPTSITGPGGGISWPEEISQQVDYEAELGVVIGKTAKDIAPEDAYDCIAGYTIVNDVSARDVQFSDEQWVRGKSFDSFCPIGPYLVTTDEINDPHQLDIRCWVNGELVQDSNTDQMIFKIPEAIAFITKTCTLLPGDILCTGTPNGVGVSREPQLFLKPGDTVEIEIENLGRLSNPVV